MNFIKNILMTALLVSGSVAYADSEAEKEAEIFMAIMGMEEVLERSMNTMLERQLKNNPGLTPFKELIREFLNKHVSYESLKPDMIQIYAETFSAEELRAINAFYKTDAGKKAIQKIPELMAKGGQIGVSRFKANISELQSLIKAESERMKQAHREKMDQAKSKEVSEGLNEK
ncbi:MAG: hypothetical protein COB51_12500 [Moraxellaceae bacterium]|nr:MAG: hypothetical protein COB51_12500 [Moraxellaceae bacterium]